MKMQSVSQWPKAEQPAERVYAVGVGAMSDAELLSLYLRPHAQHRVIDTEELFRGTLTQTSVYPRQLKDALAMVDVKVLDHFIVAGSATLSFAERGLL